MAKAQPQPTWQPAWRDWPVPETGLSKLHSVKRHLRFLLSDISSLTAHIYTPLSFTQEVLTIAHNKMTALHSGNLPALSSLRVGLPLHSTSPSCFPLPLLPPLLPSLYSSRSWSQVVNVAHNTLRDSGLPSELFTLKGLHTLVSDSTVYWLWASPLSFLFGVSFRGGGGIWPP